MLLDAPISALSWLLWAPVAAVKGVVASWDNFHKFDRHNFAHAHAEIKKAMLGGGGMPSRCWALLREHELGQAWPVEAVVVPRPL
jgi:hypothetical protein